ncbi:hypothetical protein [Pyxidicoccus sp. MSG2]|uniref:hypothetical protein n=1 Tax=Pyxidicoccus sp. MSG2 TaxID=2996790 RepID=UPI002270F42C|nr:hypothetical protein [Pyxidicoccus sp. MSG2]MCY1019434.1 hypothetical protein [Pyxidicoccus sp. MSG2]
MQVPKEESVERARRRWLWAVSLVALAASCLAVLAVAPFSPYCVKRGAGLSWRVGRYWTETGPGGTLRMCFTGSAGLADFDLELDRDDDGRFDLRAVGMSRLHPAPRQCLEREGLGWRELPPQDCVRALSFEDAPDAGPGEH